MPFGTRDIVDRMLLDQGSVTHQCDTREFTQPPVYYIITSTLKKITGMRSMRRVKTLGLLGTGVIGGGWAARALHFGIDVIAADVKPEMEGWIRGAVQNAEAALSRLTIAPLPPKGALTFTTDLLAMARQADFIQENI